MSVADCAGVKVTIQSACSEPLSCNANSMDLCGDGRKVEMDCTNSGAQRYCVEAGCSPCGATDQRPTCDGDTFIGRCQDGRPVRCDHGRESAGLRCADLGLECRGDEYDGTIYGCFGSASCQTSHSGNGMLVGVGCAATKLEACVGGYAHSIECAEVGAGFTCQTFATATGETSYFCGLAAECDADAHGLLDPTCDGNDVVLCNAARIEKVDCLGLGFTGCAPQGGRCVPGPYAEI